VSVRVGVCGASSFEEIMFGMSDMHLLRASDTSCAGVTSRALQGTVMVVEGQSSGLLLTSMNENTWLRPRIRQRCHSISAHTPQSFLLREQQLVVESFTGQQRRLRGSEALSTLIHRISAIIEKRSDSTPTRVECF